MKYTWEASDICENIVPKVGRQTYFIFRDPQRDETDMGIMIDGLIVERNKTRHQIATILNEQEARP
jgi:hypothetical protein